MFEHSTVSLLYLINHLFSEVNIYKPVTSRQGNSEVYAICLRLKDNANIDQYLPILQSAYGTELYSNTSLFPLETIPQSFLKQIEECALYFSSLQCQVINNNLQAYLMQNNIALHRDIKKIRAVVASEFVWKYDLKPLDMEQEILKGILHEENKINTNPRYERGSYTERQLYTKMTSKEKCQNLNSFLQTEVLSNPMMLINEKIKWITQDEYEQISIMFTYGRPLPKISSSKFIFVPIFKLYQQILAEDEFKEIIFSAQPTLTAKDESAKELDVKISKELSLPEFDYREQYNVYEKRCFSVLLNTLNELSAGETLLLHNFNTLSHFNVSVLYILAKKYFEKTGFTPYGKIILDNMLTKDSLKYLQVIASECEKVSGDRTKDVLNSLPVQTTNAGDFFNNIVFYNNTFYRNKCTELLAIIKQSL